MADIEVSRLGQQPNDMRIKYQDMGDGTHAEVVAAALIGGQPPGNTMDLPIDEASDALVTIENAMQEIHGGEMFSAEYTASVMNNNRIDLQITTGETKNAYITIKVAAGGQCVVYLYENPTTSSGSSIVIRNMNRASQNASACSIVHSPSVSSIGAVALINGRLIPGGTTAQTRIGSSAQIGTEWVLATGTKYLLRAINVSGGTIMINAVVEFYEEIE